jgi:ribosomal-protein-alanine N-acetyltransferase
VEVRPSTQEDIAAIVALCRGVGLEPWREQRYAKLLGQEDFDLQLALSATGRSVVGFCLSKQVGDQQELLQIAVSPLRQGRGIGGALLAACLRRPASERRVACFLEVRRSNKRAIDFYRSFGFIPAGIRKAYYRSPVEDALLMCREWRRVRQDGRERLTV